MRHNKDFARLGRTSEHRKALLRNLVTELFRRERIETTVPKAKALKRVADKMVTLAKRGDLHARRQALSWFKDAAVAARLFDVLVDQFKDRKGGYTRILRLGFRGGDSAPMCLIELVGSEAKFAVTPSKGKKAKKEGKEGKGGKETKEPKAKAAAEPKAEKKAKKAAKPESPPAKKAAKKKGSAGSADSKEG